MKLRRSILAYGVLSLLILSALTLPVLAQTKSSDQMESLDQTTPKSGNAANEGISEELKPGIVVEKVERSSEGERAGLQEGDVLLSWSRGDAKGKIESPFDLSTLFVEQAIYGTVILNGFRGTAKRDWALSYNNWGIEARPYLAQDLLTIYLRSQKLVKTAELTLAVRVWHDAALKAQNSSFPWLSVWLLFHAAEQLSAARRWKEADIFYQRAIQEAAKSGSPLNAYILRSWAEALGNRGDPTGAEKRFQQSLAESRKLGNGNFLSVANLTSIGVVAFNRADWAEAEEYFLQSLAIARKLSPRNLGIANNLAGLGMVAFNRDDLAQAEKYQRQALAIRQELAPDSPLVAASLYLLGYIALQDGDLLKSEEYNHQALAIQERFPSSRSGPLQMLGVIAMYRGDLTTAEEYYNRALVEEQTFAPNHAAMANTLGGLGRIAMERGDEVAADKYLHRALAILQNQVIHFISVDFFLGYTFDELGQLAEDRGNLAKAEEYYRQALRVKEKQSLPSLEAADTLNHLGDVACKQGSFDKAEEYYRQALAIWAKQAIGSKDAASSLAALAEIKRHKKQPEAAAQLYEQALNAFESQVAHLGGSEDIRSGFRAKYASYYENYIDLLLTQKQPEHAFQVLERLRARTLLEMLTEAHANIHKGLDASLIEKERSLHGSLNAKSERRTHLLGDESEGEQLSTLDREIKELLDQYNDVEQKIRTSSPSYAALTQPQPLSTKEVQQQLLDENTLLLEYSLGEERSYVFAVTPDSLNAYELPKRTEIERVARCAYELLTKHDRKRRDETERQKRARVAQSEADYSRTVSELSRMVLKPVAGQLQQKRLLIVSDGALQYIPFAVLPMPGIASNQSVPLVAEHEIVNLPSASVLAVLRREELERKAATKTVAVLADPVFGPKDDRVSLASNDSQPNNGHSTKAYSSDPQALSAPPEQSDLDRSAQQLGINGFPRLPFTRREADAISSIAAQGDVTEDLDFDASKATALSLQLKDYRIVHFATHGLLNNEHPELSGLVFSLVDKQGNEQDGFLRMLDIYNMELNADLVVLSACQTALGKEIGEEGLVGLTRGFMYAGAPRVVASLWKVDDEATAELMKKFYEGMLRDHQPPAQALRSAQQWMRTQKAWQSPYYWAGFELQGEWK